MAPPSCGPRRAAAWRWRMPRVSDRDWVTMVDAGRRWPWKRL
nr:hypothetical protein RVX_3211 [Nitratidesulfovibrio sp. HK-II]